MNKSQHYLLCTDPHGQHRIAYMQWGNPENPSVLFCVHGLTRNSRDFDFLAADLAAHYRVICPDVVGRGQSDWLTYPEDYNYSVYAQDMLSLLKHLNLNQVDWIGTSMGGLIGMQLASQTDSVIRHLVLNDIGAFIPKEGLEPLVQRLAQPQPHFESILQVEQFLRPTHNQFGPLTDEQWQHIAQHSAQPAKNGGYHLAYDPKIAYVFQRDCQEDVALWPIWQKVQCPVLLLHGEDSKLLNSETITQMQAIHPQMPVYHFPNIGHAPALMETQQIEIVRQWLLTVA